MNSFKEYKIDINNEFNNLTKCHICDDVLVKTSIPKISWACCKKCNYQLVFNLYYFGVSSLKDKSIHKTSVGYYSNTNKSRIMYNGIFPQKIVFIKNKQYKNI